MLKYIFIQHITRSQDSQESRTSVERSSPDKPREVRDVRELLLHQSKAILGKMLSPARDQRPSAKWFADPLQVNEVIMCHRVFYSAYRLDQKT